MVLPPLVSLSTEILLKIFKYLDIRDLCKLKQTCKRFNEIVNCWAHSFVKDDQLLVTNQVHPVIKSRSGKLLLPFERLRVSRNWKTGTYREKALLYSKMKYIPWLHLEKDLLWLSRGAEVAAYKRNAKGISTKKKVHKLRFSKADVCKFTMNDKVILACLGDGGMWMWCRETDRLIFHIENCHESDINSVDMCDDLIVSGSRDDFVRIWRKSDGYNVKHSREMLRHSLYLFDRVWSVALEKEDRSLLAIGTAGTASHTLSIFDLKTHKITANLGSRRYGAGILDIKWTSPHTVWSCGYDSCLRCWDLRTGKCEQRFEDPCEATVYCMQHDHRNTIISGTERNGRVVLWDTRLKNYVQMYFMDCCRWRDRSSPVYSLSFDAELLFTATDQHLNVLDFSIPNGKFHDYSNLFLKLIKV